MKRFIFIFLLLFSFDSMSQIKIDPKMKVKENKYNKLDGWKVGVINWTPDGDAIRITEARDPKLGMNVKIIFKSNPKMTWWKGLVSGQWEIMATHDDMNGPHSTQFPINYLKENHYHLKLAKAKTFGVHTNMYDFFVDGGGTYA